MPTTPNPGLPPEAYDWLAAHPDADPAEFERVWHLAEQAPPPDVAFVPDPDRVAAIRTRLAVLPQATDAGRKKATDRLSRRRSVRWPYVLTACVALFVAVGMGWAMVPITVTVPPGFTETQVLPDGSTVTLNSGATLQYRRTFGWRTRTVHLDGEAFFDVTSQATPFDVQTPQATVTVLGTQFNVRTWERASQGETVVVLVEGSIRLAAARNANASVTLAPGETARVHQDAAQPTMPEAVQPEPFLRWKTGGFAFDNESVPALLDAAERRFGLSMRLADTRFVNTRLSLFLNADASPDAFLEALCTPLDCTYHATNDGFVISATP